MNIELTGAETGDQLIKQLVALRHVARRLVATKDRGDTLRKEWQQIQERAPGTTEAVSAAANIAALDEAKLERRFMEIEIGRYLMSLCAALDRKASHQAICDALSISAADRTSEEMRKYGNKALHLISVLDLENSATQGADILHKPLKWCHTMAFMHELQTNEKLDRIVHDGANEFFNGAFGEYQPRPEIERLVGQRV